VFGVCVLRVTYLIIRDLLFGIIAVASLLTRWVTEVWHLEQFTAPFCRFVRNDTWHTTACCEPDVIRRQFAIDHCFHEVEHQELV
jgi:hypothetical protein